MFKHLKSSTLMGNTSKLWEDFREYEKIVCFRLTLNLSSNRIKHGILPNKVLDAKYFNVLCAYGYKISINQNKILLLIIRTDNQLWKLPGKAYYYYASDKICEKGKKLILLWIPQYSTSNLKRNNFTQQFPPHKLQWIIKRPLTIWVCWVGLLS